MKVLTVRNVHDALPRALQLLGQCGLHRHSRNGMVIQSPEPVATVYERPIERVILWPERDANPFFHLFESLWMLDGRNDVASVARYAKNMLTYSDDGETLHGAYGHRWRCHFDVDQIAEIILTLAKNQDDRRCVLQMWDPRVDGHGDGKDYPCNLTATFQVGIHGALDLVVFCRSNDIIWGAYGANAVHFSMLLEYVALALKCPMGTYTHISVNWHRYLITDGPLLSLRHAMDNAGYISNPYIEGRIIPTPMDGDIERVDELIRILVECANEGHIHHGDGPEEPWAQIWWLMLRAHDYYTTLPGEERFTESIGLLKDYHSLDWLVAGREWLERRYARWQARQGADPIKTPIL